MFDIFLHGIGRGKLESDLKSWLKLPLLELMGVGTLNMKQQNYVATRKVKDQKQQTLEFFWLIDSPKVI